MNCSNRKKQAKESEEQKMNSVDVIEVLMNREVIGRIAMTPKYLCAFEYNAEYLKSGYSISPFHLPLRNKLFIAKRTPFKGGFGVFEDSLPDGWGSILLNRYLRTKGVDPNKVTLLQRLALIGSTGRGALEYRPDFSDSSTDEMLNLNKLALETEKILTTNYSGDYLETLYRHGGSSGGARPKVFVNIDGKEWLIKFRAMNDPMNLGEIEYKYSLLAKKCGIIMPETNLFEGKYFGVERYDRTKEGRVHTVSAAGLLNADYRIPSLDYGDLLQLCHVLTKNMEEVYALFRQMVFNVEIGNRDDHAKNFSFQLINGKWKLSPAYDLLPCVGFNGYHTTTINNSGDPTKDDVMAVATKAGISKTIANEIIDEVKAVLNSSI